MGSWGEEGGRRKDDGLGSFFSFLLFLFSQIKNQNFHYLIFKFYIFINFKEYFSIFR